MFNPWSECIGNCSFRSWLFIIVLFTQGAYLLAVPCSASTVSTEVGYPLGLPLCDVTVDLQGCLNAHGQVRLEAKDYTTRSQSLVVREDQAVYGLPGTVLPPVHVMNGAHDVTLSRLRSREFDFDHGPATTRRITLYDVRGNVVGRGVKLADSRFVRVFGRIDFEGSGSSLLYNNIFVACHDQGFSPSIRLKGLPNETWDRNLFVWFSFQTPAGVSTDITGQKGLAMAGMAAESWNFTGLDRSHTPLLDIEHSGMVYLLGLDAGTSSPFPTPILKLDANVAALIDFYGDARSPGAGRPMASQGALNTLSVDGATNLRAVDIGPALVLPASGRAIDDVAFGEGLKALLSPADLMAPASFSSHEGESKPPERQTFSEAEIEKQLSSGGGYVFLKAGTYIIDHPIKLYNGQGLIGQGSLRTVLKGSPGIAVVQIVPPDGGVQDRVGVVLSNLSLVGGRVGLLAQSSNRQNGMVIQDSMFSDLLIRGASEAGILIDGIGAVDNNLFDFIRVEDSKVGIWQTSHRAPSGKDDYHLNYLDKDVWLYCSFTRNEIAIQLDAYRQDNQNAWLYSTFAHNAVAAVSLNSNAIPFFFKTTFLDNGSGPDVVLRGGGQGAARALFLRATFVSGQREHTFIDGVADIVASKMSMAGKVREVLLSSQCLQGRSTSTPCR